MTVDLFPIDLALTRQNLSDEGPMLETLDHTIRIGSHRRMGRGGAGRAAAPPKFWATQFFWAAREIWAKSF